jgi:hypothetical protein
MSQPHGTDHADDGDPTATLADEEIETRPLGTGSATFAADDTGDDSGDTGDDSGDTSDTSDTGDDSGDVSDTGDDSGDDSGAA